MRIRILGKREMEAESKVGTASNFVSEASRTQTIQKKS
jgi:hypothetical protein